MDGFRKYPFRFTTIVVVAWNSRQQYIPFKGYWESPPQLELSRLQGMRHGGKQWKQGHERKQRKKTMTLKGLELATPGWRARALPCRPPVPHSPMIITTTIWRWSVHTWSCLKKSFWHSWTLRQNTLIFTPHFESNALKCYYSPNHIQVTSSLHH